MRFAAAAGLGLLLAGGASRAAPASEDRSRAFLLASLRFADTAWDEPAGLLGDRASEGNTPGLTHAHGVRGSAWYALGLLQRDQPGDRDRAVRALRAVVAQQMNAPGKPWHGTFFRSPEEKSPTDGAKSFNEFDPNWRQFIGTTFALCLLHFEAQLPADLRAQLETSITRAVEGELAQKRLVPSYTNIALMHAFLWGFAGQRFNRPDWVRDADAWAEEVNRLFRAHDAFEEYNSPTYYGVDLYGLALWRAHGATPRVRELGAALETALWRDIAAYYHAGLKNLSGPFDRAYGMDLTRYVSLIGVWLGLVLEPELVPFPPLAGKLDHGHDFICAPTFTILGARIPADALASFRAFPGEHSFTHAISGPRVATAWLDRDLMIGAEATGLTRGADTAKSQFHAATIYWRAPDATTGWIVLRRSPSIDARAEKNLLTATTKPGDTTFQVSAPGVTPAAFTRAHWSLPGLAVDLETDAKEFDARPGEGFVEVRYRGATQFVLRTHHEP